MPDLLSFLLSNVSSPWTIVAILGFLPFTEVRIAILFGLLAGLNQYGLFFVAAAANILETIALFLLLGNKKGKKWLNSIMGKKIAKKIGKNKKLFDKYGELGLIILVTAPIPGTGAIIGAIAANMLSLDKKRSFIAICAGILISAVFVLSAANFFMIIFGSFFR